MDINLKGPIQALAPSGPIRLQNGHAQIKPLGQTFSDINVEIQLDPKVVRLSQLSLHGGEGQFSGKGVVALERYTIGNIDLTFDADHFRVIATKEYRAGLSGQIICSGSLQAPIVTGAMTVVDTTLRPDFALMKSGPAAQDATITVVRNAEEASLSVKGGQTAGEEETKKTTAIPRGGVYNQLTLNVDVTIPRNTWVHMSEGSIELMGQLQAKKNPQEEPTLSGVIETVRGWVAVQGRKFTLEKGNIIFSGETPIDPSLDITARYTLPEYVVDVLIGGTGTKPTVSFKSEPDMEQADVLSLLVFGKPANALSDKEKVSLQSQALQAVAGSVASDLRQAVAEKLGIENLELDVGENPSQSKVGIGKYVAPGVFVSTSQQLGGNSHGPGQGREVTIEYQISDNWQLKASTTAQGNNGVDILWKKKY
jgi:translocation and assembly module TamB